MPSLDPEFPEHGNEEYVDLKDCIDAASVAGSDDDIDMDVEDSSEEPEILVDVSCWSHVLPEAALSLSVNPSDHDLFAVGCQDDSVYLFRVHGDNENPVGELVRKLEGHSDSVVAVRWSHDGSLLATASYDSTVKIWEASGGNLVCTLDGPGGEVESIAWHPRGPVLLVGSADTTVWMWKINPASKSATVMQVFAGHGGPVSLVKFLSVGSKCVPLSASLDGAIIAWNPHSGQAENTFPATESSHEGGVVSLACHPSEMKVAAGYEDGTVRVIDIEHSRDVGACVASDTHHSCEGVGFSPSGNGLLLATSCLDGKIKVFETARGFSSMHCRHTLQHPAAKGEAPGCTQLRWHPLPSLAVFVTLGVSCSGLVLWNGLTGEDLVHLTGTTDNVLDAQLVQLGGSSILRVLTVCEDRSVKAFHVDMATLKQN